MSSRIKSYDKGKKNINREEGSRRSKSGRKVNKQWPKTHKNHKRKHKHYYDEEGNQVKQEEQQQREREKIDKKRKHKSKKKKKKGSSQEMKQQLKVSESPCEQTRFDKNGRRSNKNKRERANRSQASSEEKIQAIDVQLIKVQQAGSFSPTPTKRQSITFEDSERIIYLFSLDAGDYKGLKAQLPHIGQKNIRNHLRIVFQHCLDQITERVKSTGRKIKQWEPQQKRQIIRELHRIRSSNRLLSEVNVQLRQVFHKIMRTFNHRQVEMTDQQITFLYRKIQAFVRGFNQLNQFRKNFYVPPDQEDFTRKPVSEGGYIMKQKVNRSTDKVTPNIFKVYPKKLVDEWTEEQEKEICLLYLQHKNNQFMIENLKTKFGQNDKWGDFQILGQKITQIIKKGLVRLQQLTAKPYDRAQKMKQDQRKAKMKQQLQKSIKDQKLKYSTVDDFKEVTSYSSEAKEIKEGRLIKNPMLLLMQVFAHPGQSFRVSHALVHLVVEKYPFQQEVEQILKIIKDFTEWAAKEQAMNGITLVKNKPVWDNSIKINKRANQESENSSNSEQQRKQQAQFAEGLSLIQDVDEELIKQESPFKNQIKISNNEKSSFNHALNISSYYNQSAKVSNKKEANSLQQLKTGDKNGIIEVYESQQSQYEGFISKQTAKSTYN